MRRRARFGGAGALPRGLGALRAGADSVVPSALRCEVVTGHQATILAIMALTAFVVACSTSPTKPPAAAPSAADAPPTTNTVDQALIKRGFKPGLYEGKVFYCTSMLDSEHFRLTRCYTAEQIKAMDRATQGVVNHLLMPGTCHGWGCH